MRNYSDWLGGSKSSLWFVWKMDTGEYQVRKNIVFNKGGNGIIW